MERRLGDPHSNAESLRTKHKKIKAVNGFINAPLEDPFEVYAESDGISLNDNSNLSSVEGKNNRWGYYGAILENLTLH